MIGLIAGLGNDRDVSWIHDGKRQVGKTLLRADQRKRLGRGLEVLPEPPLDPPAGRLPERRKPLLKSVLAVGGVAQRLGHGGHGGLRRRRVVVTGAEVDHVHARLDEPALDRGDLGERIAWKGTHALAELDHVRWPF